MAKRRISKALLQVQVRMGVMLTVGEVEYRDLVGVAMQAGYVQVANAVVGVDDLRGCWNLDVFELASG